MKQQDLKTLADRCRLMASTADRFTKRRLLDLASKYDARSGGNPRASKTIARGAPVKTGGTSKPA